MVVCGHFQLFERDTRTIKACVWTTSYSYAPDILIELLGQIYSSKIASTLGTLCDSPVIFLNITFFFGG